MNIKIKILNDVIKLVKYMRHNMMEAEERLCSAINKRQIKQEFQ